MKTLDPIAQSILENLAHLHLGLTGIDDLNTEREYLQKLVDELYYILVLEA